MPSNLSSMKATKREIDRTANIMFKYEYPNIKDSESIQLFMNELIDICSTCKFSNVTEELLKNRIGPSSKKWSNTKSRIFHTR